MQLVPSIPGYDIERELGRGGMGVVYLAHARGQKFAIKLMVNGPHASIDDLLRFRVEIAALSALRHESIVRISDIGVSDGLPYVVTEFVAGGDLTSYIDRVNPSIEDRVRIIIDIARAVNHAHDHRILHRDIKPANILVTETGNGKLTDFGLTKFSVSIDHIGESVGVAFDSFRMADPLLRRLATELRAFYEPVHQAANTAVSETISQCTTRTGVEIEETVIQDFIDEMKSVLESNPKVEHETAAGSILGSPGYLSPEQASGQLGSIATTTDIYGLGATLYRITAGAPMFKGNVLEKLERVRNEWPVPPREVNPDVPAGVDAVIWKCIQKDPQRRYQTCLELLQDLELCLAGKAPATLLRRQAHQQRQQSRSAPADRFTNAFPPKPKDGGIKKT